MEIKLHEITIREVVNGYVDNAEEGVVGYGGKLNIRPKYQREFVYDEKKRNAVIDTIFKKYPLNVMYWTQNDDGTFEVLDGQQRTISFCQYCNSDFSVENRFFHNLTYTEQEDLLDNKLLIYFCEGKDIEKLNWFKIINIAGEKLTDQELRNATYTGTWLSDAKLKFSKSNCAAYLLAKNYVTGSPIRQEILETALRWISKGEIEKYMSIHQHDPNANELWIYFKNIIEWISLTFITYRNEMKGIDWGNLYDNNYLRLIDTIKLDNEIEKLMSDDEVTSKKGIYSFVLTNNEKYLNIRNFSDNQKREAYEKQAGICKNCGKHFDIKEMEGDHITPWHLGGKTDSNNCQMLCRECNRTKSGK